MHRDDATAGSCGICGCYLRAVPQIQERPLVAVLISPGTVRSENGAAAPRRGSRGSSLTGSPSPGPDEVPQTQGTVPSMGGEQRAALALLPPSVSALQTAATPA